MEHFWRTVERTIAISVMAVGALTLLASLGAWIATAVYLLATCD